MTYDIDTVLSMVVCKCPASWIQQLRKDTPNFLIIQQ